MRGKSSAGDLVPMDLEIEATCRRNNTERRRKILQDRTTPPILEEPQSFESSSIFPQTRRVTHEDYSSSTVPQFFTSRPKVQAHNISYPHLATYIEIYFMACRMKTRMHTWPLTLKFAIQSRLQVCGRCYATEFVLILTVWRSKKMATFV